MTRSCRPVVRPCCSRGRRQSGDEAIYGRRLACIPYNRGAVVSACTRRPVLGGPAGEQGLVL
jgi:hypothetical protein